MYLDMLMATTHDFGSTTIDNKNKNKKRKNSSNIIHDNSQRNVSHTIIPTSSSIISRTDGLSLQNSF